MWSNKADKQEQKIRQIVYILLKDAYKVISGTSFDMDGKKIVAFRLEASATDRVRNIAALVYDSDIAGDMAWRGIKPGKTKMAHPVYILRFDTSLKIASTTPNDLSIWIDPVSFGDLLYLALENGSMLIFDSTADAGLDVSTFLNQPHIEVRLPTSIKKELFDYLSDVPME